jgi:DNA-binding GntR family transcriptional regulator
MTEMAGGRVLEREGRIPLYLQLAQLLRQEIMSGRYKTGDMLPGEHALTDSYAVSPSSARSAVRVLREEGLVETRRGAGSYVRHIPPKIIVKAGPDDVVTARMPTAAERQALSLAEGVPVISLVRPGRAEELFDAGRAVITIEPLAA